MRFFKMNGLGNDYIFIDQADAPKSDFPSFVQAVCEIHTGIGADGVVTYEKGTETDLVMHIYNRDGTEAEMCGNALRCLIFHYGKRNKSVTVLTRAGIKSGILIDDLVTINLSKPVSYDTNNIVIDINGQIIQGKRVNIGNPHFVLRSAYDDDLAKKISENRFYFPDRTNVEFFSEEKNALRVQVYERGCGATLACGTGAAAVLIASGKNEANIYLPGGILFCALNNKKEILQTGEAHYNFQGEFDHVRYQQKLSEPERKLSFYGYS